MNTEYVIIPICIPNNDVDYLKVSHIPISIWHRDDTGRLTDTRKSELDAMSKAAQIYQWTDGKLSFVYGISTAGGIGDRVSAQKANKRLIDRIERCNKIDYMRGRYS